MATRNNRKVARYRKRNQINIGMVIFGMIFVFVVSRVIIYFTTEHVSAYEVKAGKIAVENSFKGLILRNETVEYASEAGYVNYYIREGEKAGVGSTVYTIDENGKVSELLKEQGEESSLSDDDMQEIQSLIKDFKTDYNEMDFNSVYDFKYDIDGKILELINVNVLSNLDSLLAGGGTPTLFEICAASQSGIVVYAVDGLEGVTAETFTADMVEGDGYKKTLLKAEALVNAGDPVYKTITEEGWSVIIGLSSERAEELAENEYIEVEFLKDNTTAWASFSIVEREGKTYGKLDFNNSMVRFASDRYMDIRLLTDNPEGLKIPVSALVDKEFYTVPAEYFTKGGNDNELGVIAETYDENGEMTQQFIATTIYSSVDGVNYIDKDLFTPGNNLVKPESTERYQIGATASLTGVYNINKGFTVFKQVKILSENEEYCIVAKNMDYGLSIYDHIVLDSTTVTENQIIN